jgi:phosphatidylglycerol---prolipoprotein diacylglyceryl transferase
MIPYPSIDPVLFSIGPLKVHWYGLMYVLGFSASYYLAKKQIDDFRFKELAGNFENLNLLLILCVVFGGRLGYVFFYNLSYYMAHPLEIPATWNGGMSLHGAALVLFAGGAVFCRIKKIDFWKSADIYIVTMPIGIGLGRIGNFINGELFGRTTTLPWGMIFPHGGAPPRHPSQLYEAFLEGLLLFLILWPRRTKPWQKRPHWPHGSLLALFFICYGIFRILVEFVREPDAQVGFLAGNFTMGQLLSSLMVLGGLLLWWWRDTSEKGDYFLRGS